MRNEEEYSESSIESRQSRSRRYTHTNRLHTSERKQAVSYRHAGADSSIPQYGFSACRNTTCGAQFLVRSTPQDRPGGSSPPPWTRASSVKRTRFIFHGASNLDRSRRRFVAVDLRRQRKIAGVDANDRVLSDVLSRIQQYEELISRYAPRIGDRIDKIGKDSEQRGVRIRNE